MTTEFEVRPDLPSAPQTGGQTGGRRGGSKYDPFVDAILLAAGRSPDGSPITMLNSANFVVPADPEALASPRWVRFPANFTERDQAYSVAGNVSQQVFKSRAAKFTEAARGLKLATSVQMATDTTAAGETTVVYHAWLRVNPASTT
jgi:hypothetical protein